MMLDCDCESCDEFCDRCRWYGGVDRGESFDPGGGVVEAAGVQG